MNSNNSKIAIIGAGITGLSIAYELQKKGVKADIFDRRSEPGGAIRSFSNGEWQYEYGPNTLLLKDKKVEDFLVDLELDDQITEANPDARKRFIVKKGDLVPIESSPVKFITSPLISAKAKLRLLAEPFIGRSENDQQSVADFFEKRFGRELLDYAINPFVAGIYAGRPELLSAKYAFPALKELEEESGSVIVGALSRAFHNRNSKDKVSRRLISFKNGLAQLPDQILKKLNDEVINEEIKIIRREITGWHIEGESGKRGPYKKVIITVPLYRWTRDLVPVVKAQFQRIQEVVYPPLSVVQLGFKKESIEHPLDGFGFLIPEVENSKILGGLFTSTLFEGRAPEGHHLLTIFVGGGRQPKFAKLQGEEMLSLVLNELRDLIGIKDEPVFKDHIFWPDSIPQYGLKHAELLDIFDEVEEKNPGLYLAGNFRGGISVPDCIKNGIELGGKLANEIQNESELL